MNGAADRSARRAERVVQRDDRGGLGEAVALHHQEAEPPPEGLHLRIQGRRAHHHGPELQTEQPVRPAVAPPAGRPVHACRRRAGRLREHALQMVPEHLEHLRHRHEHRHTAPSYLRHDVVGRVAAREDDHAVDEGRDEGGHRLPEHVAERQQVEEPDGEERPRPGLVLRDLPLDRQHVGEDVPVRQHHALGLGRRTRGEDHLGCIVGLDRDRRGVFAHEVVPADRVEAPDVPVRRRRQDRVHVRAVGDRVAHEHGPRSDDARDPAEEVDRRAVVDRDHDDAAEQASPQRHEPLGTVLAPDDDMLALPDAGGVQPRRERPGARGRFPIAVRPAAVSIVVGQELAIAGGQVVEEVDEGTPCHSAEL
jgi:hypothetical protein